MSCSHVILNTPTPPGVQHLVEPLYTFVQQKKTSHRCEVVYPGFLMRLKEAAPGPPSESNPLLVSPRRKRLANYSPARPHASCLQICVPSQSQLGWC